MGVTYYTLAFVGVKYSPILGFEAIIVAPDTLESQSRAQKTLMIV